MPGFQLILSSDTINEGRIKINDAFSATTGLWSGSTGSQSLIHNNGTGNIAASDYSISVGSNNTAAGMNSFVGGFHNVASADNQVVIGKWNDSGNTTNGAFIIGNGTDTINRRNVLEVLESNDNAVLINGLGDASTQIAFSVTNGVTTDRILKVQGDGKVAIGAGTAAHELHVIGEIGHKDAYVSFSSQITTTNALTTVLKTYTFKPTSSLNVFKISVLAFKGDGPNDVYTKVFYVSARKRAAGPGSGTYVMGIDVVHEQNPAGIVGATAVENSGNLVVTVIGEASTDWNWTCDIEVREIFTATAI